MYKFLFRPLLFSFDPESSHELAMSGLRLLSRSPSLQNVLGKICGPGYSFPIQVMGLELKNRVGLAAGFDKDAQYLKELSVLGFGHIEVGTVTPRPQSGNPRPRVYRLTKDQALLNRMGFNNQGVEAMKARLQDRPQNLVVGGNVGKNKDTALEDAHMDYLLCVKALYGLVDYFTLNVSSPNTPGLRQLQSKEPMLRLIEPVLNYSRGQERETPVLVKIAPDLDARQIEEIASVMNVLRPNGLIVNNTTISRQNLRTSAKKVEALGAGGISGRPLREPSLELLKTLRKLLDPGISLVASGGIMSPQDALDRRNAGADLVQVYTGFIYDGPSLPSRIARALV